MHWRWTDADVDQAQMGFGVHPHTVSGTPMVPVEQDVWVWLRSAHTITYHALHDATRWTNHKTQKPSLIPEGQWVPFCHHGAAFLVSVDPAQYPPVMAGRSAIAAITMLSPGRPMMQFYKDLGGNKFEAITPSNSWAAFYWHLRYATEGGPGTWYAWDRTRPKSPADFDMARKA
jgi:hypothetical protein